LTNSYGISIFGGIVEAWDIKPSLFIANNIPLIKETKDLFLTTSSSCLNHSSSNFNANSLIEELNHFITYKLIKNCLFNYLFSDFNFVTTLIKKQCYYLFATALVPNYCFNYLFSDFNFITTLIKEQCHYLLTTAPIPSYYFNHLFSNFNFITTLIKEQYHHLFATAPVPSYYFNYLFSDFNFITTLIKKQCHYLFATAVMDLINQASQLLRAELKELVNVAWTMIEPIEPCDEEW